MQDIIKMKLHKGVEPIELRVGQIIEVEMVNEQTLESMDVPMTVIKLYGDGDFDGRVVWGEA